MTLVHSPMPMLILWALAVLLSSHAAQAQVAVAFFDDYQGAYSPTQSYLVSDDGQTLRGLVFVKYFAFLRNGSLQVKLCDSGDIASSASLNGCSFPFLTVGFTCPNDICSVNVDRIHFSVCNHIGKAFIADFYTSDGLLLEAARIRAVFGFGNVSFPDCPFAKERRTHYAAAVAKMMGIGDFNIQGIIVFQQLGKALSVSGFLMGLPQSSTLGIHVHAHGDISDNAAASTSGMHFAVDGQSHGLVNNKNRHTGDLGNIVTDKNQIAAFNILVPLDIGFGSGLTLFSQNGSAIGRSIIVHASADDGVHQPAGNSGARIAQGVLGFAQNVTTSEILTLLNQGTPQGFYCACILCDAGVQYAGFCLKPNCSQPQPTCAPVPSPTSPTVSPVRHGTRMSCVELL
jgi:Cu-Zn family superoxide dismutase